MAALCKGGEDSQSPEAGLVLFSSLFRMSGIWYPLGEIYVSGQHKQNFAAVQFKVNENKSSLIYFKV